MDKAILLGFLGLFTSFYSNGQTVNKTIINSNKKCNQREMAGKTDIYVIDKRKMIVDSSLKARKIKDGAIRKENH